mmetsp:Transcript_26850/g.47355  ORF Transcript_26850/g.47355 Transcript_26850/m.47355 type:complete len:381 (-) Transcript_26850:354-1496(-)
MSSGSVDNPWESAENDHKYKAEHEKQEPHQQTSGERPQETTAATSARLNWHNGAVMSSMDVSDTLASSSGNNRRGHRNEDDENHHRSGKCCAKLTVSHVLSTLDASITLLLFSYVGYTLHQDEKKEETKMTPPQIAILCVCVLLATVIAWRALLVSCLFPGKRCSMSLSTHLTLLLSGSYAILALSAWIVANKKRDALPWCWSLGGWCSRSPKALPAILTALALLEILRWVFAQGELSQFDQDHPHSSSRQSPSARRHYGDDDSSFTTSRRHRPWWWNRHNYSRNHDQDDSGINESLLGNNGQPGWSSSGNQSYLVDDGVGGTQTRGFLGWFGRGRSSSHNPRDDGSVDYESLNEEWASRSEEDPYWWTREENNQGGSSA